MLQRAASNAYSWWWASHIRTKQSKWLEQNLQDMEDKVQSTLKILEEDGDSFAKRAEMYYKKRPELINFVEESYRAYRALAERYDHISTELQNANTTIASVFPEQVQFAMDEEDDEATPRFQKKSPDVSKSNIPKVPKIPIKDLKSILTSATKKLQKKSTKKATTTTVAKSGLSKSLALEEIDKLQKQILSMQTEKEFVKSSYESGLAKYWDIEKQITEMQEKVCGLQDEFGAGMVIEDDEARTLMASAALKSCQETLAQLQEKQEKSAEDAKVEHRRIKEAREKFELLKDEFDGNQISQEKPSAKNESVKAVEELKGLDQEVGSATTQGRKELETLRGKIKEHFEVGSNASLSMTELAEKIDQLANKVISLETAVSSQTALIQRLRTETDELQAQIQTLEDDKAALINGEQNLSNTLREMEEKLHGLQDLNRSVEDRNINLQTHFTEASSNLDHLSEKLLSVKTDVELEATKPPQTEKKSLVQDKSEKEIEGRGGALNPIDSFEKLQSVKPDEEIKISGSVQKGEESLVSLKEFEEQEEKLDHGDGSEKVRDVKTEMGDDIEEHGIRSTTRNQGKDVCQSQANDEPDTLSEKFQDVKPQDKIDNQASLQAVNNLLDIERREQATGQEDEPDWRQLFLNGMEDREKVLLKEYTTVLRNFKEAKKKLSEAEMRSGDSLFETTVQLRELKSANAAKDEEIRSLRLKLSFLQTTFDGNKDLNELKASEGSNLPDDQYVDPKVRSDISTEILTTLSTEKEVTEVIRVILIDQPQTTSAIEEKFRMSIDELLEENLDFWLRFSTSFHEIQKFETEVQDLQVEISKLEKTQKKQEGSSTKKHSLKSDARPIYKHLREIQTELTVWLEKSALLKDELRFRFSNLCSIQEEITMALKASAEDDDFKFTSYQAAKFQGEVLNMKQENNKVADELQAGLDHVTTLQLEVEKTLAKLGEEFGLSASKNHHNVQLQHSESRSRVPLRSFIFGVKQKKQRPSFFSCVHPALHRKYNGLRSGLHR